MKFKDPAPMTKNGKKVWSVIVAGVAIWLIWAYLIYTPTPLDCPEGEREVRFYSPFNLILPGLGRACTENGRSPYDSLV